MFQQLFQNTTNKEKTDALERLIAHSMPSSDFFLMIALSVLMATFGLLSDSSAVIVGSMLIAPILYPILSLAMGVVMSDFMLVAKASRTLGKAIALTVGIGAFVAVFFSSSTDAYTAEIMARTTPSLVFGAIGIVAGFAAAFAMVKPKLSETLPGVAISVALIPPLSVVGIGFAHLDMRIVADALLLFFINALGVIFSGIFVFSLMNFYAKRDLAEQVVKKEEKELKQEEQVAEKK